MPSRIGCQLALRQLKNCIALIWQIESFLNLLKNTNSVICDGYLCAYRGFRDSNRNVPSARMVFCIVEHFRETVMPNIPDVLRLRSQYRGDVLIPYNVFFEVRRDLILPLPF